MSISNLKVGTRLAAGFAAVLVLLFVVTSVGLSRLAAVQGNAEAIVHGNMERIDLAEGTAELSRANLQTTTMMLLTSNKHDIDALLALINSRSATITVSRNALAHLVDSEEEKTLVGDMIQTLSKYKNERTAMAPLLLQGKNAQARAYFNAQVDPAFKAYIATVDTLVKHEQDAAMAANEKNAQIYDSARTFILVAGGFAIVLGVLFALLIARSITRPLNRAVQVAQALSIGDLSVSIEATSSDEVGQVLGAISELVRSLNGISDEVVRLAEAAGRGDFTARGDITRFRNSFATMTGRLNSLMETSENGLSEVARVVEAHSNKDQSQKMVGDFHGSFGKLRDDTNRMTESLGRIVLQIRDASEQVSSAAGQIAIGNSDLSQRTEEQASSLEETASSMEELTSTVKQNAENAQQANQLAIGASEIAAKGGSVVTQVVDTMAAMNESSKKIADIIGVIDGIAFQTNILALNAAVEAARAGEQGRGFAVVAGEVRNLAQRSANAAKEIKGLIGDSVAKTDAGTKLVDEAGRTMSEIVTAVKRVSDIISEITAASLEQGEGIEQVNQAITQMDQVTQQNAALVEESAAAAASLEEQAKSLVDSIAQVKVSNDVLALRAQRQPAIKPPAPHAQLPQPKQRRMPERKALVAGAAATGGNGKTHKQIQISDDDGDWETF